jgi:thiamine monophosphate synthase
MSSDEVLKELRDLYGLSGVVMDVIHRESLNLGQSLFLTGAICWEVLLDAGIDAVTAEEKGKTKEVKEVVERLRDIIESHGAEVLLMAISLIIGASGLIMIEGSDSDLSSLLEAVEIEKRALEVGSDE